MYCNGYEQVAGAYTFCHTWGKYMYVHVRKYTCIYMYVHVRMPNSPLENFTPYNLALYKLAPIPDKVAQLGKLPSSLVQTHTRLFIDNWDWFNINIRVFTFISHYYNKAGFCTGT